MKLENSYERHIPISQTINILLLDKLKGEAHGDLEHHKILSW